MAGWDGAPYPTLGAYDAWKTEAPEDEAGRIARRGSYTPLLPPAAPVADDQPDDDDVRF